jgi:hypothetical protein
MSAQQQRQLLVPQRPSPALVLGTAARQSSSVSLTWWYSAELRSALIALNRDERGLRERLQEQQAKAFEDCMFVAAQTRTLLRKLAAEAKANGITLQAGKSSTSTSRQHSSSVQAAGKRQTEAAAVREQVPVEKIALNQLFFPQSPPRPVSVGFRQLHRTLDPKLPYDDVNRVVNEEQSVRMWIEGLERKWRDPIVQECVHSWVLLTATHQIEVTEQEQSQLLLLEEENMWKMIMRSEFKKRPASVHLVQVVRRAMSASPKRRADEEASDDETTVGIDAEKIVRREGKLRAGIAANEDAARRECFAWLWERYAVRLFSTVRCEDLERVDIEEQAGEALTTLAVKFQPPMVAISC